MRLYTSAPAASPELPAVAALCLSPRATYRIGFGAMVMNEGLGVVVAVNYRSEPFRN